MAEGLQARAGASAGDGKPAAAGEPLAEWEQELLASATAAPADGAPAAATPTETPTDAS